MRGKKRSWLWIVGLLATSSSVLWPFFRSGFFQTDDGNWMIIRLSAFFQTWREGQFPVRFLGRLNDSYGYPVANFLYPGFLYIGSLIHATGLSFVTSTKVLLVGSVLLGVLSIFFWLRNYFSVRVSFLGALNYLFSPYLLFDIYRRGSVGEVLSMGVAAFVLYACETNKKFWFTIGFALLLVSHNSLAVLFAFFFGFLLLLERKFSYLLSIVISLGMTAFFWFPAINEQKFVIFNSVTVSQPFSYFITSSNWYLLGIAGILATILLVFNHRHLPEKTKWYIFVFVVSLCLTLPISQFLWSIPLLAKLFQFPYRLLSVSVIASSFIVAALLSMQKGLKQFLLIGVFLLMWLVFAARILGQIQYTHEPESYYTTNEATTTVADEYMPIWVHDVPNQHQPTKLEFYKGRGTFENMQISTQKIHGIVNATDDSIIQINTVYYPGWGASLGDGPAVLTYDNPQGVIRLAVPKGTHELDVEFRETVSRFLATSISAVSIVGFLLWNIIPRTFFIAMQHFFEQVIPEKQNSGIRNGKKIKKRKKTL